MSFSQRDGDYYDWMLEGLAECGETIFGLNRFLIEEMELEPRAAHYHVIRWWKQNRRLFI